MKSIKVLIFFLTFTCVSLSISAGQFANPLDVRLADPQVLYDNGTWYLYATSGGGGFKVWTSDDLVNWRDRGKAFNTTASNWGKNRFWAPEVIKPPTGSYYYMVYSAGGGTDNVLRICVARATSPLGPFTDIAAPLFDDGKAYIDAHVFIDSDNQAYLYCSQDISHPADNKSEIVVAKLNASFTAITTDPTLCITPSASWEGGTKKWNEAPSVIKNNGYYYLLYSGSVYSSPNYSIGYAYATNPLGPWTKYSGNPIVKKNSTVSGPGHCSTTLSPDGTEHWLVYHTQQQLSGGGERQLAIDKFSFADQPSGPDRLVVTGPTTTLQSAPSDTPAFPAGSSDEFNGSSVNRNRWTVFNENTNNHSFNSSSLVIKTIDGDIYEETRANLQNLFLQYPPDDDFRITAKINFSPGENFEQAGIFVWQDHNNYIRFSNAWIGGHKFEIGIETQAGFTAQQLANTYPDNFWLRIEKVGNIYTFFACTDGTNWSQVGVPETVNLIDRKIGLAASSPISGRKLNAAFDYFHTEPILSGIATWSLY